jgi:hypothetical protein
MVTVAVKRLPAALLIAIALSGLAIACNMHLGLAQSPIPTPSVPEFTVKYGG